MRCGHAKRQMTPYLDDRLSADERAALEQHLQGCEACARELRLLQGAGRALAQAEPAPVPDGLAARLAAGALASRPERRPAPASAGGLAGLLDGMRWPALATAAAAVTLAVGLFVAAPRPHPGALSAQDTLAGLVTRDEADLDQDVSETMASVLGLEEE